MNIDRLNYNTKHIQLYLYIQICLVHISGTFGVSYIFRAEAKLAVDIIA